MDLDSVGSPRGLATRIHELAPDLPPDFDIRELCRQLDIEQIQRVDTSSYVAALITDEHRAAGAILLSCHTGPRRARFSIAHELGHFLIGSHSPGNGERFSCSREDLKPSGPKQKDRHKRFEAEANRFAAELLMPTAKINARMISPEPDLGEAVRLADEFAVSKEAMLRRYVELHPGTIAVVGLQGSRIEAIYKSEDFPWIDALRGQSVPTNSIAHSHELSPGTITRLEECAPETWLGEWAARKVEVLCEQVMAQRGGVSMILLYAELGG